MPSLLHVLISAVKLRLELFCRPHAASVSGVMLSANSVFALPSKISTSPTIFSCHVLKSTPLKIISPQYSTNRSALRFPSVSCVPAKSSLDSLLAEVRSRRYRPRTLTRKEFRKWRFRELERLIICRSLFARFVHEIAKNYMAAPRFQQLSIEALYYADESNLVKLFEDMNLLAILAKRITVDDSYIKLIRRILSVV